MRREQASAKHSDECGSGGACPRRVQGRALAFLLLLAACAGPPPSAYIGGHGSSGVEVSLGRISSGEQCTQTPVATGAVIYCGTWQQPSGVIRAEPGTASQPLTTLATVSAWRSGLDNRFICGDPVSASILGGIPSLELSCKRRVGGWPQVAIVTAVRGTTYYADGILPAAAVLERSIGVLSGTITAAAAPSLPQSDAAALAAQRLAARAFSAGDVGQYHDLMLAGLRANLGERFVAAEQADRAALELQRRVIGRDDPATSAAMMQLAVQLSDQGRATEAEALFTQAAVLAARSTDPNALPRLDYDRGLAALNENNPAAALPLLRDAEQRYTALVPRDLLAANPVSASGVAFGSRTAHASFATGAPLAPKQQTALIGIIEARRYQAIALRDLGRYAEARQKIDAAGALAEARDLHQQTLTARLYRTSSLVAAANGGGGGSGLRLATIDFAESEPGSRPLAQTYLLRAAQAMQAGSAQPALADCRQAATLLTQLHAGTSSELVAPCLAAYAAEAQRDPAAAQGPLAEMFAFAQLVQGSVTSQQIALASARLVAGARNPLVGDAIRKQQDAQIALADLERQRDAAAEANAPAGTTPTDLPKRIAAAQATLVDTDSALQTAAPNYGQLVQQSVAAADVLAALRPGEAFASVTFTPDGGWIFVLRDGRIAVAPTKATSGQIAALVRQVRSTIELTTATPPPFAIAAAQSLYADTFGRLAPQLDGARALVVAPAGPLLSMPMELMLTGPADPANLAAAPWLVRKFAISHVPAPANFVTLRNAATLSAPKPWFGFGDFHNVTVAQAERSFPSGACEDSAKLFAGLPPLPFARRELAVARALLGGGVDDQLQGAAFTAPHVMAQDLRQYRVLHFATHALLPTDLHCQSEPAIVTSNPAGAANAAGALLTSSDVMNLQLNADVVIISACNSAGPDGSPAGESLSGLARAFFYAGARAVMVTHWSVNDQSSAFLVASTLKALRTNPGMGIAEALRTAQLALIDQARKPGAAGFAHPFYWAAFALVGEGGSHQDAPSAGPKPSPTS